MMCWFGLGGGPHQRMVLIMIAVLRVAVLGGRSVICIFVAGASRWTGRGR